jgi:hypothetical protein
MITLKNNRTTEDPRLDRIPHFDERSRNFKIAATLPATKKPRSYTWSCKEHLDQGSEGACVGFGITHELIARPAVVKGLDAKYAKEQIYWQAQREDPWPGGSYPGATPFYEGTSVLNGLKVAQALGWFDSYLWSFSLDELILGVGYNGPATLGINWHNGMMNTDAKGFIHVTGKVAGGHCILCKGVNIKGQYFVLHNSWGKDWGVGGDCKISFADMEKLLYEEGEAAFPVGRHAVPIMR